MGLSIDVPTYIYIHPNIQILELFLLGQGLELAADPDQEKWRKSSEATCTYVP